MEPALSTPFRPPPVCVMGWLSGNPRLGFRAAGSTVHQGLNAGKYLIGIGDTASVVRYAWLESLKAQQQSLDSPGASPATGSLPTIQGVAASGTYGSKKAAALAAETAAIGDTRSDIKNSGKHNEYGGWVLSKDGKYTYTLPVTFGQDGHFYPSNVTVPSGYGAVASFHTHPDSGSWGEGFSEGDVNWANQNRMNIYVGMSYSGNVRVYVPGVTKYNGFNGVTGDLIGNVP